MLLLFYLFSFIVRGGRSCRIIYKVRLNSVLKTSIIYNVYSCDIYLHVYDAACRPTLSSYHALMSEKQKLKKKMFKSKDFSSS